eukprot:PhF_6_TR20542/c0_g1_i2/m.29664
MAIPYRRQRVDGSCAILGLYFPIHDKGAQTLLTKAASYRSPRAAAQFVSPVQVSVEKESRKRFLDDVLNAQTLQDCQMAGKALWEVLESTSGIVTSLKRQLEQRTAHVERLQEALENAGTMVKERTPLVSPQAKSLMSSEGRTPTNNTVSVTLPVIASAEKDSDLLSRVPVMSLEATPPQQATPGEAAATDATTTPTPHAPSSATKQHSHHHHHHLKNSNNEIANSPSDAVSHPFPPPSVSPRRPAQLGAHIADRTDAPFAQRWARGAVTIEELEARYDAIETASKSTPKVSDVVKFLAHLGDFGKLSSEGELETNVLTVLKKVSKGRGAPLSPVARPASSDTRGHGDVVVTKEQFVFVAMNFLKR